MDEFKKYREVRRKYFAMKKIADTQGDGIKFNHLIKNDGNLSAQQLSAFVAQNTNRSSPPKKRVSTESTASIYIHDILDSLFKTQSFSKYTKTNILEHDAQKNILSEFVKIKILDVLQEINNDSDLPKNELTRLLFHKVFSELVETRNNTQISSHFSGVNCFLQLDDSVVKCSSLILEKSPYFDIWVFQKLTKHNYASGKTFTTRGVCFVSGADVPVYYFLGLRDKRARKDQHISLSILQPHSVTKIKDEGSILIGNHHTFDLTNNTIQNRLIGIKNASTKFPQGIGRDFINDPSVDLKSWFKDLESLLINK